MNQTHHPFGDPSSTQYHQRDQLLVELARRASTPPGASRVHRDPLAAVSGEIAVPVRHGWTVVAVALLTVALAACTVLAIAL